MKTPTAPQDSNRIPCPDGNPECAVMHYAAQDSPEPPERFGYMDDLAEPQDSGEPKEIKHLREWYQRLIPKYLPPDPGKEEIWLVTPQEILSLVEEARLTQTQQATPDSETGSRANVHPSEPQAPESGEPLASHRHILRTHYKSQVKYCIICRQPCTNDAECTLCDGHASPLTPVEGSGEPEDCVCDEKGYCAFHLPPREVRVIDAILNKVEHGYVIDENLTNAEIHAEAKAAIELLLLEARNNGRRIQAEATYDKWKWWKDNRGDLDFNVFLDAQVRAWQYEVGQSNQKGKK